MHPHLTHATAQARSDDLRRYAASRRSAAEQAARAQRSRPLVRLVTLRTRRGQQTVVPLT